MFIYVYQRRTDIHFINVSYTHCKYKKKKKLQHNKERINVPIIFFFTLKVSCKRKELKILSICERNIRSIFVVLAYQFVTDTTSICLYLKYAKVYDDISVAPKPDKN